jgi:integrase
MGNAARRHHIEAAKTRLREIEDRLAKGNYIPAKKIPTFSDISASWLEFKRSNLRNSTWSVYLGHTQNHFREFIDLPVNRLTTAKIEEFIATRQNQGMNINTLRKILVTLNQIFSYAVRHGYIENNPLRDAERPKTAGKTKKPRIRILNPTEINAFLEAETNVKYKALFLLAIMSGARQGELLGLKWHDIDWQTNQVHIQRTFNNGAWYAPKTETSNRKIDLGPVMMKALGYDNRKLTRKWG